MENSDIPLSPSAPQSVITAWSGSRGQDLLGLRSPAERVAGRLMDGVTTISPLVRYLGFRSWVIQRYTNKLGADNSTAFSAFAGKCEAALVLGHRLADLPTLGMIGSKKANDAVAQGESGLIAKTQTSILAMDAYAGPSQDLGFSTPRSKVPGLSTERGVPLASEVARALDQQAALMDLDTTSESQLLNPRHAEELGHAFPMNSPAGIEREMLIEAICPPFPREGETPRLAAYCWLLNLAANSGGPLQEDEIAVFAAAIEGGGINCPEILTGVADGWLRFLVRDLLVAVHERAVSVVLAALQESPNRLATVEAMMIRFEHLDPGPILRSLGLPSFTCGSPIGKVYEAVRAVCANPTSRGGLNRWDGPLDELSIIVAAKHREPEVLVLLPIGWMLAVQRAELGLSDSTLSVDEWSRASAARLALGKVIVPMVRSWQGSNEPLGRVIAKLTRRSVDQHLRIAWSRMQADPSRNVALLVSDGATWVADGELRGGRATSRLYQAIYWLKQLGLIDETGITVDGTSVLNRGLQTLAAAGSP